MAEARLAVGFQFAVTDEGVVVNLDKEILKLMANSAYKSMKRRCNDAKNTFLKGVYPASPATWIFFLGALLSARYTEHGTTMDLLQRMEKEFPAKHRFDHSTILAICIFTVVTLIWLFSAYVCQFILRRLLSNWSMMKNARGKLTIMNKLWLVSIKVLSGFNPGLYSFQNSLPKLPVPSLEDTLQRHLKSVEPFMSEADYNNVVQLTEGFKNGVGPKLQRYLKLKALWSPNYVSDWWEKFIYLRSRSPLMINSNYYGVGSLYAPKSSIQTARAANIIHALFKYRKTIDNHTMAPLRLMLLYPLCSSQYTRQFNTTRIPGKEQDELVTVPESNYVIVYHKGRFFKLAVIFSGNLLKPVDIQAKLNKIVENFDDKPGPGEEYLPVLTATDRPVWAEMRSKFFSSGVNRSSLDLIEKAAFFVVLEEDSEYWSFETSSQDDINNFSRRMLHGKGYNRWFDKSFNFIVCKNGQIGFNAEHSWADAPIMAHVWEWVFIEDVEKLGYDKDGNCHGTPKFNWPLSTKLQWEIPEECISVINSSFVKVQKEINDVELFTLIHTQFGKGEIKKCKVSPDAFCQVAFQLAYYKSMKKVCLTYESAMARLFRDGRTETVRSCSMASTNFVKAAVDPTISREVKRDLLIKACNYHTQTTIDAMTGKGVDRHLFALYVVSQYLQLDVPFLKTVLSEKWLLSTSQTAVNQTMRLDIENKPEHACAGGGFGPVAENGYGISYIICGENLISFHVSCKKSCPDTNSEMFAKLISESMLEMLHYILDDKAKH
ncbi:carnitine O-palmitoyltransferase 1, liver isoform isoform X2 [Hydra vulgaris]|uniref:Carnitine O-palmitoyltransferase 1, liver isoform isoform X2 n=1 Tax=Hydra vulgaris TaxID=6087 RepID=A0ABM4D303_HYDVU